MDADEFAAMASDSRKERMIMDLIPPPEDGEVQYAEWKIKGIYYLNNSIYNGILDLSNLLVTWYVLDTEYDHIHIKYISEWKVVAAFTLQVIFLLDVIATLIVIRPSHITSTRKEVLFEIFLQILAAGTILN